MSGTELASMISDVMRGATWTMPSKTDENGVRHFSEADLNAYLIERANAVAAVVVAEQEAEKFECEIKQLKQGEIL